MKNQKLQIAETEFCKAVQQLANARKSALKCVGQEVVDLQKAMEAASENSVRVWAEMAKESN